MATLFSLSFRVLYEFEDNARFEIADGLVFDPSQLSEPGGGRGCVGTPEHAQRVRFAPELPQSI